MDLFFTRVSPSKLFDVLADDFNYAVSPVLVGMLCVAVVAKKLSSQTVEDGLAVIAIMKCRNNGMHVIVCGIIINVYSAINLSLL